MAKKWWALSLAAALSLGAGAAMARGSVAQADPSATGKPMSSEKPMSSDKEAASMKPVKLSSLDKDQVKKVQKSLATSGYYFDGIDGIAGPKTRAALHSFAHANAIAFISGELDEKMITALNLEPSDIQPVSGKDKSSTDKCCKDMGGTEEKPQSEMKPQSGVESHSTADEKVNQSGGVSPEYKPNSTGDNGSTSPASGGQTASNPTGMNAGTDPQEPGSDVGAPVSSPTPPSSDIEPQRGNEGTADPATISQAQVVLKQKGLYQGEPSGLLDENTKSAIKEFQKENKMADTGMLDNDTLAKLGVSNPSGAMTPSGATTPSGAMTPSDMPPR